MSLTATFLPAARVTGTRAREEWLDASLSTLFDTVVARSPTNAALIDGDARLSFLELQHLSDRVAAGFRYLGLGVGDVIAYQLPNWWEAVVVFLAAARIGASINPLLPTFRERELDFALRQGGARAAVVPGNYRGYDFRLLWSGLRTAHPRLEQVLVARDDSGSGTGSFTELLNTPTDRTLRPAAPDPVDPDSILLLMYTSGTTADPKGVLHTHNTLIAEVQSLRRVHQLTPADRTLMPSPLTHISGVIHSILTPAVLGTSAVLMDRWDPARALELMAGERVSYMVGAPTFLEDLVTHANRSPTRGGDSLRLFSCGGASVAPDLIRRARTRFPRCVAKRVYGSTEFPTITTTDEHDARTRGIDTEGRPIAPAEVRIVDDTGAIQAPGGEGEVQARGPECFVGYLDTSLNHGAFTTDGWFRTGDLGVIDADGYLRITGRLKDIIIRKGEKISVKEVEDLISEHPAVAEIAVIARPDPQTGERACALVRLRPGATLSLAELTTHLAAKGLAKPKWPEQLQLVAEFPRTESGKIVRSKL